MEIAEGLISAVRGHRATVRVDAPLTCARCAAGRGCGAALLQGTDRVTTIEIDVPPGCSAAVGDRVQLTVASGELLRGAMLGYGIPLAGMLAVPGLLAGLTSAPGDAATVLAAAGGLLAGWLASRYLLRRGNPCRRLVATIESSGNGRVR